MGLLVVTGVLRTKQFWPEARSDADTATVDLVPQAKKPFVFVNNAGQRKTTKVFDNAVVLGKFGPNAVVNQPKTSTVRRVTVRLQGIDAPELHFQPQVPGAGGKGIIHPFRQSLGETSANALHDIVAAIGLVEIPCEVVTVVNTPNEVCDVYGRIVGNLVLTLGSVRIDLNQRLLREGWVLPGLYNSMSKPEIQAVLADHQMAKQNKRGLFSRKIVTTKLAPFDDQRRERKGPTSFKPFSDEGPVNFPKFFRRQAELHVRTANGETVPADLRAFIKTKKDDLAMATSKFLALKGPTTGAKAKAKFDNLATFLGGNKYPMGPEVVFFENDSLLVKAGTTTPIKDW